jgi:hypothetical protein
MQVSDGSSTAAGTFILDVRTENSAPEILDGGVIIPGIGCPTAVFQQLPAQTVTLPAARQGRPYGASLEVNLGRVNPLSLTWSVAEGSLPPGLVVDQANGIVRGTPLSSASGTYRFRIAVRGTHPTEGPQIAACGGACPQYVINVQ